MQEQILAFARKLWKDFLGFSAGQKAATIAAGIALIAGAFVYSTWQSTPSYSPLYTNLAPSDASAIVDKLNSGGIPVPLGAAGTEILVPADKVYSTRLTMSAAGLPNSSQTGYSLLDKEGVTTSDFQQQVDFQRAIEGELAKTIQSINGVLSASVHLALPQQNVFNDGTQKPTAAVMLTTSAGTNAHHPAGAVGRLPRQLGRDGHVARRRHRHRPERQRPRGARAAGSPTRSARARRPSRRRTTTTGSRPASRT